MRKAILILLIYLLILLLFGFSFAVSPANSFGKVVLEDGTVLPGVFVGRNAFIITGDCPPSVKVFVNGHRAEARKFAEDQMLDICLYKTERNLPVVPLKIMNSLPALGDTVRVLLCNKEICPVLLKKEVVGSNFYFLYVEGRYKKGTFLLYRDKVAGFLRRHSDGLAAFASAPVLQKAVRYLEKGESPRWGWLGVYLSEEEEGLRIKGLDEGGPASKAGLLKGDIILEFGGNPTPSFYELLYYVLLTEPGKKVPVKVKRDEQVRVIYVTIGERRKVSKSAPPKPAAIGIVVREENGKIVVVEVLPQSGAKSLLPGDVILKVNGKRVYSVEQLKNILKRFKPGDMLRITVKRGTTELTVEVRLTEKRSSFSWWFQFPSDREWSWNWEDWKNESWRKRLKRSFLG